MSVEVQTRDQLATELIGTAEEDEIIRRIAGGENNLYALIVRKYNKR